MKPIESTKVNNSISSGSKSDGDSTNPCALDKLESCDILVQVDSFEAGGLENVVLDLNRILEEAGYRVTLLVLGSCGPAVERAKTMGMEVITRAYSHVSYGKLLDQIKPRLVIAHYSINGSAICRQLSIPLIQIIQNTYVWFSKKQQEEFSKAVADTTLCVAISEYAKAFSVSRLGVDQTRCIVIPIGIDFDPFDRMDFAETRQRLRARHKIEDNEFVFLDIGAINHQKNHLGTLRAFEIAQQSAPNIHLVILGPAYEKALLQELETYISARGLARKVAYFGQVGNPHEYFAMADAFVSGAFFEGGPLTLLEAKKITHSLQPIPGFAINEKCLLFLNSRDFFFRLGSGTRCEV